MRAQSLSCPTLRQATKLYVTDLESFARRRASRGLAQSLKNIRHCAAVFAFTTSNKNTLSSLVEAEPVSGDSCLIEVAAVDDLNLVGSGWTRCLHRFRTALV